MHTTSPACNQHARLSVQVQACTVQHGQSTMDGPVCTVQHEKLRRTYDNWKSIEEAWLNTHASPAALLSMQGPVCNAHSYMHMTSRAYKQHARPSMHSPACMANACIVQNAQSSIHSSGWMHELASFANWKRIEETKVTIWLCKHPKIFLSGACTIKHYRFVIYEFRNKLLCSSKLVWLVTGSRKDTSLQWNLSISHKLQIHNVL